MHDDDDQAQLFFGSTIVVCALMIVFLLVGGCVGLGLTTDEDKGLPGFWRSLERQSGFSSP